MLYSNRELKELCLKWAKDADPERAEFLRGLARNYEAAENEEPDGLTIREVLIVAAVIYILCLPLFWYAARPYEPTIAPTGAAVEQLVGFQPIGDHRYSARVFLFVRERVIDNRQVHYRDFANPLPLVVYEGTNPLPAANYEIQVLTPSDIWRFVTIRASDNSDPRTNGRRYYLVLPHPGATTR